MQLIYNDGKCQDVWLENGLVKCSQCWEPSPILDTNATPKLHSITVMWKYFKGKLSFSFFSHQVFLTHNLELESCLIYICVVEK